VTYYPASEVRTNGFTVGSDGEGTRQARGVFEDLETFNYPLSANEIVMNLETNRPPSAIPGLRLWLRADVGVGTNEARQLETWLDQTCSGLDALQSSATKRPVLGTNQGGNPVVWFYGTNYLNLPSFTTNGWAEADGFLVIKAEADPPTTLRQHWTFGGTGGAWYPHTDGSIYDDFFRRGNATGTTNPAVPLTDRHLYNATSTSAAWTSRINGTVIYTDTNNVFGFWDQPQGARLGAGGNVHEGFQGYIGEVLIYGRVLSDAERSRVQNYLNARYTIW
jgi:hypothetical protein